MREILTDQEIEKRREWLFRIPNRSVRSITMLNEAISIIATAHRVDFDVTFWAAAREVCKEFLRETVVFEERCDAETKPTTTD